MSRPLRRSWSHRAPVTSGGSTNPAARILLDVPTITIGTSRTDALATHSITYTVVDKDGVAVVDPPPVYLHSRDNSIAYAENMRVHRQGWAFRYTWNTYPGSTRNLDPTNVYANFTAPAPLNQWTNLKSGVTASIVVTQPTVGTTIGDSGFASAMAKDAGGVDLPSNQVYLVSANETIMTCNPMSGFCKRVGAGAQPTITAQTTHPQADVSGDKPVYDPAHSVLVEPYDQALDIWDRNAQLREADATAWGFHQSQWWDGDGFSALIQSSAVIAPGYGSRTHAPRMMLDGSASGGSTLFHVLSSSIQQPALYTHEMGFKWRVQMDDSQWPYDWLAEWFAQVKFFEGWHPFGGITRFQTAITGPTYGKQQLVGDYPGDIIGGHFGLADQDIAYSSAQPVKPTVRELFNNRWHDHVVRYRSHTRNAGTIHFTPRNGNVFDASGLADCVFSVDQSGEPTVAVGSWINIASGYIQSYQITAYDAPTRTATLQKVMVFPMSQNQLSPEGDYIFSTKLDGVCTLWVDGVRIVDVRRGAAGVPAPITGTHWCEMQDVCAIWVEQAINMFGYGSSQTDNSPPWALDIQDLWYTAKAA